MAASLSGLMTVMFMTPLDVVSTRMYNQPVDAAGKGTMYKGILDCFGKTMSTEGVFGLYKGCSANFLRLTPHSILSLLFWQQLRQFYMSFSIPQTNVQSSVD